MKCIFISRGRYGCGLYKSAGVGVGKDG